MQTNSPNITRARLVALVIGLGSLAVGLLRLPSEWYWLINVACVPGGLAFMLYAFNPKPLLSPWPLTFLIAAPLLGLLLTLPVERHFGGGDYWHSWRGYPMRWLEGAQVYTSSQPLVWTPNLVGLIVDTLVWLNFTALALLPVWGLAWLRLMRATTHHSSPTSNL